MAMEIKVKTVQDHNGSDVRNTSAFYDVDAALYHVKKCLMDNNYKKVVLEYNK